MQQTAGNNYRPTVDGYFQYADGGVDEGFLARESCYEANLYLNSMYPRTDFKALGCIWHPPPWNQRLRLGEAKNPGPQQSMMTISALNVQFLNGFLEEGRFIQDVDVAVYSETAATSFVQQKATKVAHSSGRHLVRSKAVANRSFADGRLCVTKGQASGTAILSTLPTRPVRSAWTPECWNTGRVVDSFILTSVGMVYICAVYGLHQGLPDANLHNEDILREVGQRASLLNCPAIILGDLNTDIQGLLAWQILQDQGWQDAALWQEFKDGNPPANTYKEETRIDYILVNATAAMALRSFSVSMQPETDHKSVSAVFDWSVLPTKIQHFRMPSEVTVSGLSEDELRHAYVPSFLLARLRDALEAQDVDSAWNFFAEAYEGAVAYATQNKTGQQLPKSFYARAKGRLHEAPHVETQVPYARLGEFQPTGEETNLTLRQRIRQVRRIATYAAQSEAMHRYHPGTDLWQRANVARQKTWAAVVSSSGFSGPFQKWWMEQHRDEFPLGFPSVAVARAMLQVLKKDEIHWRQHARKLRSQHTSKVFHDDWKLGGAKHFSAIKPPGMPRVDSLDVSSTHRVQLCRARGKKRTTFLVRDDDLQCIRVGCRWSQGSSTATVSKIVQGKIHLANVCGTFKSGSILQYRPTAMPHEITQVAGEYWRSFWNTKKHTHAQDAEIQNAIDALPDLPDLDINIDQQDLVANQLDPRKDGTSTQDTGGGRRILNKAYYDFGIGLQALGQNRHEKDVTTRHPPPSYYFIWISAREMFRRYGCYGANKSLVGVPEGCPIAVGQMILLTWVFTLAMKQESETALYSYVDDWILLTSETEPLIKAIFKIQSLATKFGLILSLSKSGVFATNQKLAKQLQGTLAHQGITIGLVKNFKGLGVNFQTAKQLGTQLRDERWTKAKVLLKRLQYMPWTEKVKTQIVNRGILPLTFYGAQTWMAGKDFIREVRAKCNDSVWGKKQYHLHYLAPLFSGADYEPMLYLAKYRFSSFMRMVARDLTLVTEVWNLAISNKAYFKRFTKGTVSLLQCQLNDLGWELKQDGTCTSCGGWIFKIWDISMAQFQHLVREDWEQGLLQHLRLKQNIHDIQTFSAYRSQYPSLADPMLEGFMRKVRLGGLFPQRRRSHVNDAQDDTCHFCGEVDTLKHRVHYCPATYSVRQSPDWEEVSTQLDSVLLAGLFQKLPGFDKYQQQLDALGHPDIVCPSFDSPRYSLFTDGSASHGNCPFLRLCGWAVTCAHGDGPKNTVLTAGLLPGGKQTVFRAEFQAVNVAIASAPCVDVYTDNQAVARIVNHLLVSGYCNERWFTHPDRGLIVTCSRLLARKARGDVTVTWVKAHRAITSAANNRDLWLIHHNAAADSAAQQPLLHIPPLLAGPRSELNARLLSDVAIKYKACKILRMVMDEFP
ncbi:unnamed protein product [Symbiodinium sp. CCMP2456]|nr:unnamed protein product [Symbiodinium sp. CCMP2456]